MVHLTKRHTQCSWDNCPLPASKQLSFDPQMWFPTQPIPVCKDHGAEAASPSDGIVLGPLAGTHVLG